MGISSDSGSSKINKLVIFHNKNVTFKMVQVSYRKRRFAEANLAFFLGGGRGGHIRKHAETTSLVYQLVVDKC